MQYIYFRGKDEEDSDIQDLIMSFGGLEEKVLEQYTFAKVWPSSEVFCVPRIVTVSVVHQFGYIVSIFHLSYRHLMPSIYLKLLYQILPGKF